MTHTWLGCLASEDFPHLEPLTDFVPLVALLLHLRLLLLLIVVEVASDVVRAKPYTNDIYNAEGLP